MIAALAMVAAILILSIIMIEIRKTTDADLWETKYFTLVMKELFIRPPSKIGITHNIFTSKQTHCISKLSTLAAPRMHINIIEK
jgi:hypothetical protein